MINQKKLKLPNSGFPIARVKAIRNASQNCKKSREIKQLGTLANKFSKPSTDVFFNTCFEKNNLKTLIAWFLDQYGEKLTVDLVEILKEVGFHQATRAGVSLGIDDLQIPPQKATLLSQASTKLENVRNAIETGNLTSVEKSQRLIDTWNQTSETLRQTAVQNFRMTNPVNPVYMMAFSGARGNISQVRQLVAMRGLMADPQGAILEFPIQSNFREGLTVTEYLISCYGARKGLVDTALRTATSGYLTRRLVDAVQHVVIHIKDCETKKGILLKEKNLEQRLIGRVLLQDVVLTSNTIISKNTLISPRLSKQISSVHKEILVRSPLTCQTEKSVCQLCYGLDLGRGKLVSIGEAVGIIAAQSIGEPGTQLTMRTFHTGGVGVFSDQALKSFTAPFDGKVEYLDSLPGLFVRTPHGNIVFLLKHKTIDEAKPILKLVPNSYERGVSSTSNIYEITTKDVPSGSLLWVKQGEIVKTGQLLIQASRFQTATKEMPESSHPVRSPLSGEIFFQSMAIRIIEEEKRTAKKKKPQTLTISQINQKEVSPQFPTLVELGNFWIFSSFVQKELSYAKSFFVKGDFLSNETPIQQYSFYIHSKGQLKRAKSSVVFASTANNFLFSKIHYSGLFYFFVLNQQNVIVYTHSSKQTILNWFPLLNVNDSSNLRVGYYSICFSENTGTSLKGSDLISQTFLKSSVGTPNDVDTKNDIFAKAKGLSIGKEFLKGGNNTNQETQVTGYFWSPHQVFTLKTVLNQKLKTNLDLNQKELFDSSCFVLVQGEKTFSQNGAFQVETSSDSNTLYKSRFLGHFVKNPLNKKHQNDSESSFINQGLKKADIILKFPYQINLIRKPSIWFYFPEKFVSPSLSSTLSEIVLQPGKNFETIRFDNSYVSTNVLNTQNFVFSKTKFKSTFLFYSISEITNEKIQFGDISSKCIRLTPMTTREFNRKTATDFCFYQKEQTDSHEQFSFSRKRKQSISILLYFQKICYQNFPDTRSIKETWLNQKKITSVFSVKSPVFTKQQKTHFKNTPSQPISFNILTPEACGWLSNSQLLKVEIRFNCLKTANKIEQLQEKVILANFQNRSLNSKSCKRATPHEIGITAFNLVFYQKIKLNNSNQFRFQTFEKSFVLPQYSLTRAFLKAKKLGEFSGFRNKQNHTHLNILRNQDFITLKIPSQLIQNSTTEAKIGIQIRWGQEIFSNFAVSASGQILKLTTKTVTLRKGIPLLASVRGLIHISHHDLVQKNDLLITLRSRRLQTEDIVQGIPKIEQLFEARETQGGELIQNNMHTLLADFFSRARKVKPIQEAVQLSLAYIQKFLVDNILEAYSNQGVHIAEKHVELVVRQMTTRVRITQGGDTGFLPGEFVQLRLIEKLNFRLEQLNQRPAHYEPVILGITKSVLQSESFLLAASFQQVSKVLVRSALAKKTDFLRGLHENILVGQPIPAGTGILDLNQLPGHFLKTPESSPNFSETENGLVNNL